MFELDLTIIVVMLLYFALIIGVGIAYKSKANKSSDNYFIGGRTLGPWLTALSAEASDMSGWLLMGLPGLAYFTGVANAGWVAAGLVIGTYLNWKFVAKRLRVYSEIANNSITLPDFFSNRFHDKKNLLMTISALIIFVFFCIYVGSCFVACGKLFNSLFGLDYIHMMIFAALVVFLYTLLGGYLSVCTTDLIQSILMCLALVVVFVGTIVSVGGIENAVSILNDIPGFLSWNTSANPLDNGGFSQPQDASFAILSGLAWGLGYFGMPHVLVRFMGIKKPKDVAASRVIAVTWLIISLGCAICIGLLGRAFLPSEFLTQSSAENVFVVLSKILLPSFFCGLISTGILAASMSSSSSYLLISSSSIAKNFYKGILKKDASDKQIMFVAKISIIVVVCFGIFISLDVDSSIFSITSYAWSGLGASFGPLILLSLYWRKTTLYGALAGMVSGALSVLVYNGLLSPLGGVFELYSILPCFIFSFLMIVVVSLCTQNKSNNLEKEFKQMIKKVKE